MSLLGAPLELSDLDGLLDRYPDFDGELPEDALYWSKDELELFVSSNGQVRPRESAKASAPSCALLSRLRQHLAELRVREPPGDYLSLCRHLKQHRRAQQLPHIADVTDVPRLTKAPADLQAAFVVPRPKDWRARAWSMDFWKREFGSAWWKFRARSPQFSGDCKDADTAAMEGTVAEFVDYVRVVQKMDPACKEEHAMAFPRFLLDNWCPFVGGGRHLFDWRQLKLEGVKDLSLRWMSVFASSFNLNSEEFLARYFRVTMSPPGGMGRLHLENHGAHVWFTQVEGRRVFFLFPPQHASCLHQEQGDYCDGPEGYTSWASSVDLFHPNLKKHPRFRGASVQVAVLAPGDSLVLPSGWWRCSVALDPSVTLHHPFWNCSNRGRLIHELTEAFAHEEMPPELQERAAANLAQIHEHIMDDDSDAEE